MLLLQKGGICINSYQTLGSRVSARVEIKKSEFLAAAAPVQTETDALAFLENIRAANRTANHNVYAYSLRQNARQRYSDDGEPAKTAGLPVLGIITHADITDCIFVVTRYFGGTLLGTGGLVRAYTAAAKAALDVATIVNVRLCIRLSLSLPYPQFEPVQRLLLAEGTKLDEPLFGQYVQLSALLPAEAGPALGEKLNEMLRGSFAPEWSKPFYLAF